MPSTPESYSYFMTTELFGLMRPRFAETNVSWGTLVDQDELERALEGQTGDYELRGTDKGRAVVIYPGVGGVLGDVRAHVLDAYDRKIAAAGGIDLHVVGGRGHVAFHESGIPFEGDRVLLVRLDDDTVENGVVDGHFASVADSPRYAVSMGTEVVYEARRMVLLANGARKTGPVAGSILGEVSCDVSVSYGRRYAEADGALVYVLDEAAAVGVLDARDEVLARGCTIGDDRRLARRLVPARRRPRRLAGAPQRTHGVGRRRPSGRLRPGAAHRRFAPRRAQAAVRQVGLQP